MRTKPHQGTLSVRDNSSIANHYFMSMPKLWIKFFRTFVIFLVIFSWIFSGFPQIFNFPPEVEEARAQTADINVQRGTADIGVAGGTAAPGTPFGSLSSAFVKLQSNRTNNAGPSTVDAVTYHADDLSGTVELTGTNQLTFTRQSASTNANFKFAWESWEYVGASGGANEFIVRSRNTVTLASVESATEALDTTPTSINKTIPFITGIKSGQTSADANAITAIAWLTGTNTLNVKRGGGSTGTTVVQVVTVEFTGSNWQVAHGRVTGNTGDTGTITLVDAADGTTTGGGDIVNWATAVIFHQLKADSDLANDALADTSSAYRPGANTTTVAWAFHTDHAVGTAADDHFVHVLRHPDLALTRFTSTGSLQGANNVDVTSAGLTNLAQSASELSCTSSGTGAAYARGWKNGRLTSLTNFEHRVHRSGNTIDCAIQIINLSGILGISFNQSAYRLFNNADSTDVGTALAAQDTAATLGSAGAAFRLRTLLHITGTGGLSASGQNFKLQFAQQSGTCDTAFSGETYADVTAATVIAYNNNATPADGADLTDNANDPEHNCPSCHTNVNQDYEELNNFTNSVAAIPAGQDGKWDFSLKDNGATASTAYCFRAVKSDGSQLDTYSVVPQITTAAAASLTFTVSTNNFPTITPNSPVFATTTLSIDSSGGWNITLSGDDQSPTNTACDLDTDASIGLTDQLEWIPGAATTTAGNSVRISSLDNSADALAFRVMTASGTVPFRSTAWWGTTDSYIDSATTLWAGIASSTASNKKIGESSVSSGGGAVLSTVLYYLDVPTTQRTGAYSCPLTYTAVAL